MNVASRSLGRALGIIGLLALGAVTEGCLFSPRCRPTGESCQTNDDCCAGACVGGRCLATGGSTCKPASEPCSSNGECCGSGTCNVVCSSDSCQGAGSECSRDAQCCGGMTCNASTGRCG